MSTPHVEQPEGPQEAGFTVTDKRRIDPETGEVRAASPAPADSDAQAEAELVEADVTAAELAVAELTADLQRVHAEYANYRKRVDRDREVSRDTATAGALTELLPILDDINRAREHDELEGAFRSVGEALEAVAARLGLTTFGAVGEEFDPTHHEALTHEADESGDAPTVTVVTAVYQSGYALGSRVLRPARVGVADQPVTALPEH
ncbi:MAG: nucleotide exchange factor GrpE [Actinomycetes bacterium]